MKKKDDERELYVTWGQYFISDNADKIPKRDWVDEENTGILEQLGRMYLEDSTDDNWIIEAVKVTGILLRAGETQEQVIKFLRQMRLFFDDLRKIKVEERKLAVKDPPFD